MTFHRTPTEEHPTNSALFQEEVSKTALERASNEFAQSFQTYLKTDVFRELLESLCFLDAVAVMPGALSRGFILLPLSPECSASSHAYVSAVSKLLSKDRSVGDHPVFTAGLPSIDKLPIETEDELERFLKASNSDTVLMTNFARHDYGVASAAQLTSERDLKIHIPPVYLESSKSANQKRHGGKLQRVSENIMEFSSTLNDYRTEILSQNAKPLRTLLCIPMASWIRSADGRLKPFAFGSLFIGLSKLPNGKVFPTILELLKSRFLQTAGVAMRNRIDQTTGRLTERISFAHQVSAVMDSIVESVARLPSKTQESMGGNLLAKLHLLRATINSYRSKASRIDPGVFPYLPKNENPLDVYRDIGIQLGFARAVDTSAPADAPNTDRELARKVRTAGRAALRPENQIGQPGFDVYRDFFEKLPEPHTSTKDHLEHSNFAVLILLILKQAVYHTIRARIFSDHNVRISVSVTKPSPDLLLECVVKNPRVKNDDCGQQSKDALELRELAERLSDIPDHPTKYSVDGPAFNVPMNCWTTTIRIHSQLTL